MARGMSIRGWLAIGIGTEAQEDGMEMEAKRIF